MIYRMIEYGSPQNATQAVLKEVADRLVSLDGQALQAEMAAIQLENQELNRLMQERQFAIQLKGLAAQRNQERATGAARAVRQKLDRNIQRAMGTMIEAASAVDEHALQAELGALQAELQELNLQMQQRQYALNLKQMLAQQHSQVVMGFPGQPIPGVQFNLGFAGTHPSGATLGAGARQPDIETKRQAVLDLLRLQPGRTWSPAQVRRALIERGMSDPDAGTPIRNLMWKMEKDRLLEKPRAGVYVLPGGARIVSEGQPSAGAQPSDEPDPPGPGGPDRSPSD